eukprot:TRINITY_DN47352_c0_g1_i2.p1 TRINITY_DN47352_c0_g1~~TRINITY_DN47352_c0_g1_i2.p1  ORF type:complete len:523 (+),score=31.29 TRINITY_DN47352_c0_g1_i2:31-1569(+)
MAREVLHESFSTYIMGAQWFVVRHLPGAIVTLGYPVGASASEDVPTVVCPPPRPWSAQCNEFVAADGALNSPEVEGMFEGAFDELLGYQQLTSLRTSATALLIASEKRPLTMTEKLRIAEEATASLQEFGHLIRIFEGLRLADCLMAYSICNEDQRRLQRSLRHVCQVASANLEALAALRPAAAKTMLGRMKADTGHLCNRTWTDRVLLDLVGGDAEEVSKVITPLVIQAGMDLAFDMADNATEHLEAAIKAYSGSIQTTQGVIAPFLYPAELSPQNICSMSDVHMASLPTPTLWHLRADIHMLQDLNETGRPSPLSGGVFSAWRDVSGHYSWLHTSIEHLLAHLETNNVRLSHYVFNLGGADGNCFAGSLYDPANCLLSKNWSGLVFEGNVNRILDLITNFGTRPDVHLKLGWFTPELMVASAEAVAAPRSPDLLKIDIDNCDCCVLEALLDRYDPKFIHVEIEAELPPQLVRRHPFIYQDAAYCALAWEDVKSTLLCCLSQDVRVVFENQ